MDDDVNDDNDDDSGLRHRQQCILAISNILRNIIRFLTRREASIFPFGLRVSLQMVRGAVVIIHIDLITTPLIFESAL